MESSRFFVSRKLFLVCIKILLGNCCLPQAPFDTCLVIGEKVITICYVDDLIFWARNKKDIVELVIHLCAEGVDLEQDNEHAEFLEFK
ncbi:hypothetical protein ACHAXS_001012 [Conticribra weissflogii]